MGSGRLATEYVQTTGRKVNDVMTPEVRTVTEDTPLEEVVHLMERHQVKRVLVLRDDKLVGIVTRPIYCTRWRALAPRRSRGRPVTRPFASGSMRSSRASRGLQSVSLTSWCATESCTFRARCSMSGIAGRSARPQNVFPGSRPSKIALYGSEPISGMVMPAFEEVTTPQAKASSTPSQGPQVKGTA
jgi:CBS domain